MSGHSKWASIKHKKAATDAKRGKLFSRLIREITVAAKMGGGDSNSNPRLRLAVQNAKSANMPADNIIRAIKKGTGELPGVVYEESTFEGYGPGGVAVMVEVMTDNRNRTVADVRHIFAKHNGNLGSTNCVAWLFDMKGIFLINRESADEEQLLEIVLETGGEDLIEEDGQFQIKCALESFESIRTALEAAGIESEVAEITRIPQTTVKIEGKQALQLLKMLEKLEDHDDVQNVFANFEIDDEILQSMSI